jgi:hypothetical protein
LVREDPPREERTAKPLIVLLALVAVLLGAFALHFFVGGAQPSDPEHQTHHDRSLQIGGVEIQLSRAPLYAKERSVARHTSQTSRPARTVKTQAHR